MPFDDEVTLRGWLRDFTRRCPRWGWRANHKKVHRLWIAEGLHVPEMQGNTPLRGIRMLVDVMSPTRPNVSLAMDFEFDRTTNKRIPKFLNVADESTREPLASNVDHPDDVDGVVR